MSEIELKAAVARIIDPVAFSDAYIGNRVLIHGDGILKRRSKRQNLALTKADAILALGSADGDEAEDALSIYRALQSVQPVYYASAIRVTTDVPFSWYVIGPDGEVAYC